MTTHEIVYPAKEARPQEVELETRIDDKWNAKGAHERMRGIVSLQQQSLACEPQESSRRTHHASLRSQHHAFVPFSLEVLQQSRQSPRDPIDLGQKVLGYNDDTKAFAL